MLSFEQCFQDWRHQCQYPAANAVAAVAVVVVVAMVVKSWLWLLGFRVPNFQLSPAMSRPLDLKPYMKAEALNV